MIDSLEGGVAFAMGVTAAVELAAERNAEQERNEKEAVLRLALLSCLP